MVHAPYVELLVEQQARRWQLRREENRGQARGHTVAISRLPGAKGEDVAHGIGRALGYDVFDQEIIHEIAQRADLSDRIVSALDEKNRSMLSEWLVAFGADRYISTYEYVHELRKVIGAIARHGRAVILGRGAHLILGLGEAMRVLVIAPLEVRVENVVRDLSMPARDARRWILAREAERQAFLGKHFHARLGDPEAFDLVVNTEVLGIAGAVDAVGAAVARMSVHQAV
jgi:cytidylate kinase